MSNIKFKTTHHQNIQLNNYVRFVVYRIIETMYDDVLNDSFKLTYFVKDFLGGSEKYLTNHTGNIDDNMKVFYDGLERTVINFSETIDDSSSYKSDGYKHIIKINYEYTDLLKNIGTWLKNTHKGKHTLFGIKFINLLPFKQMVRKILGKEKYDVTTFAKFISTCDISIFKEFISQLGTILAHEMKHMFDNITTGGSYRDEKTDAFYNLSDKDKVKNHSKYINLRQEVDARIQEAMYNSDSSIDGIDNFDEYLKVFIKGFRINDYKKLTPENKKYVDQHAHRYFTLRKNGVKMDDTHMIEEGVEEATFSINQGISLICSDLGIDSPEIVLINNDEFTDENKSFAAYSPSTQVVYCVIKHRSVADILRSIAHELMHHKQNLEGRLVPEAGDDGDAYENEANAYSGMIMRRLGRELPDIFKTTISETKTHKTKYIISEEQSQKLIRRYLL